MKKWLKENWPWFVLIGIIIAVLLISRSNNNDYKRQIKAKNDSLVILKREYQELEKASEISSELISAYKFADSLYQDSLKVSREQLIIQKRSYEKKMVDLSRVPISEQYTLVTEWLDSLSIYR